MDRGWIEAGSGMDRGWIGDGSRMDRGWIEDGSGMDRGWIEDGSGMDRGWIGDVTATHSPSSPEKKTTFGFARVGWPAMSRSAGVSLSVGWLLLPTCRGVGGLLLLQDKTPVPFDR